MSVILKSDKKATVSLGNINGIKGAQDWSVFLDFENEIYSTKLAGVLKKDYLLTDVVEASRTNLNGAPISINKIGVEKLVESNTEVRTALLKNGRFGLLAEDTNQNFFLNSSVPVSQTIVMPAAATRIIISCEGLGSITVGGDVVGAGAVITKDTPRVFDRVSTTVACNLNIVVTGSVTHVQVELATGAHTASSKVKTSAVSVTRPREIVKLKKSIFDAMITNKSGFTVLLQTISYNPVVNSSNNFANHLSIEADTTYKIFAIVGQNTLNQYIGYTQSFIDSVATNNTAVTSGSVSSENRFKLHNTAIAFGVGQALCAYNGNKQAVLAITNPISMSNIFFGVGHSSPIALNGLRGIVTKCLIYDRVLTHDEVVELTKSWI